MSRSSWGGKGGRAVPAILAALAVIAAFGAANLAAPARPASRPLEETAGPILIAHAGGVLDGHHYTNSREAVLKAAADGFRFVELDLRKAADGVLVAVHDWGMFQRITGGDETGPVPASDEVRRRKIHGRYGTLTAGDINRLFAEHPYLVLVTDKLDDFAALLGQIDFPDRDERLWVEVFTYEKYREALERGIRYPMLCADTPGKLAEALPLARRGRVKMLTTSTGMLDARPGLLADLTAAGARVLVYTANDTEYMRANFPARAGGFYTDAVTPAMMGDSDGQD